MPNSWNEYCKVRRMFLKQSSWNKLSLIGPATDLLLATLVASALFTDANAAESPQATDVFQQAKTAYTALPTSLNRIGSFIEKYVMKNKYSQAHAEELLFIKNHPEAALAIVNSGCASMKISYGVCGIHILNNEESRAWSEEADAVRHFSFSALLASITALKKILNKELAVILKGDTICADPATAIAKIENMSTEDFHTLMVKTYEEIKVKFPAYCL